jgi:uncharacterized protein (DUF1015 family)
VPKILPFRGTHFDPKKVGDLSKVITQPYDKIDDALQKTYYERHDHNIVRLIRRREEEGDTGGMQKYAGAAKTLEAWLKAGVLVTDGKPAFYACYQTYSTPEGEKTRKGFVAMVRAEPFGGKNGVHPHEETHSGPKIDRRRLLDHTRTHFGQIFLLYSDPERTVNRILDEVATRPPDLEAMDDAGVLHRVWAVSDPGAVEVIQGDLAKRDAIVADGHHRFETAVGYHQEMMQRGARAGGAESFENVMCTLVNMDDEGLTVLPAHRVVYGLRDFDPHRLGRGSGQYFEVRDYPFATPEEEKSARQEMLEDLRIEGFTRPTFGVAMRGHPAYQIYILRNPREAAALVREKKSEAWRSLDINVLHTVILDNLLGIGKSALEREENVAFVRHVDDALKMLGDPKYQAAFLVNPVRVEQIKALVRNGERFPQKSTDFFPKMVTGMVFCRLQFTEA